MFILLFGYTCVLSITVLIKIVVWSKLNTFGNHDTALNKRNAFANIDQICHFLEI